MKSDLNKMLNAVKEFHEKHGFDVGTKDRKTMYYRMNLLIEELGEISQSLTKGYPEDKIAEEHADLFILLLGNCISMDIDLTDAFWKKLEKIMERPTKIIEENEKRVSDWDK
jgi:NTP pyrophosphatase (non-canonical NTP hydrolase)